MKNAWASPIQPVRSQNLSRLAVGKKLTDKRIAHYEKLGWYSPEFRAARKALMDRNRVRTGNFTAESDGRLVYNPA